VKNNPIVWLLGATGFTGKHLTPELQAAGYQVITSEVDITQAGAVEKTMLQIQPDYIINLAGISFIPDGEGADIYAINTFGPQNILNACLKLKTSPQKIILASSSLIYGQQTQETLDENCTANPINHYGCSKWAMEQIAKTYQDKLNIIITRPFNYTGIGQNNKFLIPKIVAHFKQKEPMISLGNIDIWRDFSDVRWIAKAYTELLTLKTGKTTKLNLCAGQLTSIREIISLLQEITGHEIKIEINPDFVRKNEIKKQKGSNQSLYKCLPTLTKNTSFKDTLKWMLLN